MNEKNSPEAVFFNKVTKKETARYSFITKNVKL